MKIKLDLKYHLRDREVEAFPKLRDVSEMLIATAVKQRYPKEMNRDASKIWARIQRKLGEDTDEIELEESDFKWLYEQVDKAEYPAMLSSWRWIFTDYLEELKKKKEKRADLKEVK